jgi:hypothetical protein
MRGPLGQKITFQIRYDEDHKYKDYIKVPTQIGDTVRQIVARRGAPDLAKEVARLNKIANADTVLRHAPKKDHKGKPIRHPNDRKSIRLPGTLRASQALHAYADFGGRAPRIEGGYAKLETVDRPGRAGLSHFVGYDPARMTIPLTFDAWESPSAFSGAPAELDEDMDQLERMAGRGDFSGTAKGSPPLLRISTLNNDGRPCWLIPQNWQWSTSNDAAPLWRIADIDWDEAPYRNGAGHRLRQDCTVTVEAYTPVAKARSSSKRNKDKGAKGGKPKPGPRVKTNYILYVGDQLAAGTVGPFRQQVKSKAYVTPNTATGRTSTQALSVLQGAVATKHDVVVFDVGVNDTNATTLRTNLDAALVQARKGPNRPLIVFTLIGATFAALNTQIRSFAPANSDVRLVDWENLGASYLKAGVPTSSGYKRRAALTVDKAL